MVPRNREKWETEALEELTGPLELGAPTAMCEVASDYEDLRSEPWNQFAQSREWLGRRTASEMKIRDVENPSGHGPGTIARTSTRSRSGSQAAETSS